MKMASMVKKGLISSYKVEKVGETERGRKGKEKRLK